MKMKRALMMALMMTALIVMTSMASFGKEVSQKGFLIQYDISKWVTCKAAYGYSTSTQYHHNCQNQQQIVVQVPTEHTGLTGKINNEYSRNISFITLYFTVYDSNGSIVETKTASVNNLGPNENATFSIDLDNRGQTAVLTGFDYYYRDGACERISLK